MNQTARGVIIFVTVLITIWLWAPLSSDASRKPDGVIVTDTYFGPLRYLTLHTELKEHDYKMERRLDRTRLAITTTISAALWITVIWQLKRRALPAPV